MAINNTALSIRYLRHKILLFQGIKILSTKSLFDEKNYVSQAVLKTCL